MNGQKTHLFLPPRTEWENLSRLWRAPQTRSISVPRQAALLLGASAILGTFGAGLFDAQIAIAARSLSPQMIAVFDRITRLGSSGYIFLTAALCVLGGVYLAHYARGLRRSVAMRLVASRGLLVFATAATSGIASQVVKHVIGRARPRLMDQAGVYHFDMFSITAKLASFPSGHTVTAFATAYALGLFLPKWRAALYLTAIAVGVSRVALGAHYPSDVVAGAVIGYASAWLTARAFAKRHIAVEISGGRIEARGPGLIASALRRQAKSAKASPQV